MGGVFLIEAGKAKVHVMPDFCATPIRNDDDLNKWLRFYEASAPLVCCTSLLSNDPVRSQTSSLSYTTYPLKHEQNTVDRFGAA